MPTHLRLVVDPRSGPTARQPPRRSRAETSAAHVLDARVEQALSVMASRSPQGASDLFDLVSRPVYALALAITRDAAAAQDVAVEAFTEIWATCRDRPDAAGSAWVMEVVCRCARSRQAQRRPHSTEHLRLVPSV